MNQKRTLKKFTALTMSLLMVSSLAIPSFADESADIDAKVQSFMNNAKNIYSEEMDNTIGPQSKLPQSFIYQYVDDEYIYTYQNIDGEEAVGLQEIESTDADSLIGPLAVTDPITGGIGARQAIKANGKNNITGKVKLPNAGTVSTTGTPYIYSGFTGGSKEADMGMQWSNSMGGSGEEGWRPYVKVGGTIVTTDDGSNFVAPYNQVRYKNGYLPGETINFYVYTNYNSTGKVRMKLEGFAAHANTSGTGSNSFLTTIVEYTTSVSTPTHFKVLGTVAGGDNITGKYTTTFSNLLVNGSAPSASDYVAPVTSYATVSRSGSTVTISINK